VRHFFLVITIFQLSLCLGNEGWKQIASNEYTEAKRFFLKAYAQDSSDLSSIEGLIYLSEVAENELDYKKYITKYLEITKDAQVYSLFHELFDRAPSEVIHSTSSIIYHNIHRAEKQKKHYYYEQQKNILRLVNQELQWSFIGPFQNIQGSGHIEPYLVEQSPFDTLQAYQSKLGVDLYWFSPEHMKETQELDFDNHLAYIKSGTYYANAFFFVDSAFHAQLRIKRSRPIKVWIDDALIYENNELKSGKLWDDEMVDIALSSGTHRILIKASDYNPSSYSFDLFNFIDSQEDRKTNIDLFLSLENESNKDNYLAIRFTDTLGLVSQHVFNTDSISCNGFASKLSESAHRTLHYFQSLAKSKPSYFHNYLLAKAYMKTAAFKEGEAYFYALLGSKPSQLFYQHLVSKFYSVNGKIEKLYETMKQKENDHNFFFALLKKDHEEIDKNTEEDTWLSSIYSLLEINPSDIDIIEEYVDYCEENGMEDQKTAIINNTVTLYPSLNKALQADNFSTSTKEISNKKKIKQLEKSLEIAFDEDVWEELCFLLDGTEAYEKLYETYRLKIKHEPYNIKLRMEFMDLFLETNPAEAINILDEVSHISPNTYNLHIAYAKAYEELNEFDLSYRHYFLAKLYGFGYYTGMLISKLEQHGDNSNKKDLFDLSQGIEDGWEEYYKDESDVILKYTKEILFREELNPLVFQDMLIQVLNEEGAKKWTEYNFSFLGNIRHIRVIKKDGSEIRPDIQYGHAVFKNLQAGDQIEVSGKSTLSPSSQLVGQYYFYNHMSFEAPVLYSKLEVITPKATPIQYKLHKLNDVLKKESKDGMDYYKWEYKKIPAVIREEAITNELDLYQTIIISTIPQWKDVIDWYQKETYRITEPNYEIKEIVDSLISKEMTASQKVETLYNYITSNINYSYVSFLQSDFVPQNPSNTISSKIGDCKDVSSLMVSMLRYIGIKANYTLVKTSNLGFHNIPPSLFFDHVITSYVLEGKTHYIDLTTDYYNYRVLPAMNVSQPSLIINSNNNVLRRLPNDFLSKDKSHTEYSSYATLDGKRALKATFLTKYHGAEAGYLREKLSTKSSTEKKSFLVSYLEIQDKLRLVDYRFDDVHAVSSSLGAIFNTYTHHYSDKIFNYSIFKVPYVQKHTYGPVFQKDQRKNLLDIQKITEINPIKQVVEIKLPEGSRLIQRLRPIVIENKKFGRYETVFKKYKSKLVVINTCSFKKQFIAPSEFNDFRKFYLRLVEADELFIAIDN